MRTVRLDWRTLHRLASGSLRTFEAPPAQTVRDHEWQKHDHAVAKKLHRSNPSFPCRPEQSEGVLRNHLSCCGSWEGRAGLLRPFGLQPSLGTARKEAWFLVDMGRNRDLGASAETEKRAEKVTGFPSGQCMHKEALSLVGIVHGSSHPCPFLYVTRREVPTW